MNTRPFVTFMTIKKEILPKTLIIEGFKTLQKSTR